MAVRRDLFLLLLVSLYIVSCKPRQTTETGEPAPRVYSAPYDTLHDDIAAFIAGISHNVSGCMPKLDTLSSWRRYSLWMDSGFADLDTGRFAKMREWADEELVNRYAGTTVFYPFGGPDLLNANVFYPNAGSYILIGLEPVGILPELCKMGTDQINKYLEDVSYSLKDIFERSYFITGNMISALRRSSVKGSVPVLSIFIKRNGYNIVSVRNIGIDSTGSWDFADSLTNVTPLTKGIKIDFVADTGRSIQSVFYFQTDISDEGLKKNPAFQKYLDKLPVCYTYLKAASYLMHGSEYSIIRNTVFEKSRTILQDDSGIAFRLFDKSVWNIKLYGKYQRPGSEFSWINEKDLAAALKDPSVKPVPFTLGYNWRTHAINMLYAVKKL